MEICIDVFWSCSSQHVPLPQLALGVMLRYPLSIRTKSKRYVHLDLDFENVQPMYRESS
jgi:hypothetical protein